MLHIISIFLILLKHVFRPNLSCILETVSYVLEKNMYSAVKWSGFKKLWLYALAGVAQWIECQSVNQSINGSIPRQGHMLGLWSDHLLGATERPTHWCFSFSFSSPLSKNNKSFLKMLCRRENNANHEDDCSGICLTVSLSGPASVDVRWCPPLALGSLFETTSHLQSLAISFHC